MIAAHLTTAEGMDSLLFVLEPGNIEKLKQGNPIHKSIQEFLPNSKEKLEIVICYSPDVEWVARSVSAGRELGEVLEESVGRPEVIVRGRGAEDLKRII